MNQVPAFDYVGLTPEAAAGGMPLYYLLACGMLLGLAVIGRRRQLGQ